MFPIYNRLFHCDNNLKIGNHVCEINKKPCSTYKYTEKNSMDQISFEFFNMKYYVM